NKRLTDFTYDTTGRLVRQIVADSSVTGSSNKLLFGFEYSYDLNNNITQLVIKTTDKTVKNKFTFGKDNLPATFTLSTGKKVNYTYDGLNRLTKTSLTTSTNTPIDTTYTYFASKRGSGYTTTKLKSETINGEKYEYKYDARSNITDVTKDGVLQYHYGYDMMNQLVSVDDKLNGKVYNYTYDAGGNLISETVTDSNGTTSNAYEYNNSNWGDVLTSYNGQNITYDEIGNPLTYRDGMSMTWKNGRQLATLTNGDTSISYGYDSDSVRTTKTVNGVKYTYAYLNGQLLYETRGDAKFYYSYDANGILYNVRYTLTDGGTEYSYYYTHNSRGDIVGIYNGAGELKAHYEYDAWGNVISITDNNGNAITSPNHIGNLNPFRYRSYYQDTETGLYYLMSRYYDAVTHRFINADGYFQAGTSILDGNTFAYCANNPIYSSDPTGSSIIFGALIGGATEFFGQIISGKSIDEVDWGSVFVSAGTGAILGAVDVLGVGAVAGVLIKGGVSFTGSFIKYSMQGEDFNLAVQHSAVDGLLTMGFASISNVFKTSSGNHYNYNVNNSNQRVNRWSTSIENVVDNSRSFKPKVYAPSKPKPVPKKQTQCRSCGRPIGNKYWQCSSPSYY
ncbi:MAG: RHS repeat-associated core domain-containing protein, partial [Ruminococcus sp.]